MQENLVETEAVQNEATEDLIGEPFAVIESDPGK